MLEILHLINIGNDMWHFVLVYLYNLLCIFRPLQPPQMIAVAGTLPKLPIIAAIPPVGMVDAEVLSSSSSSKATTNLVSSNAGLPPFIAMPPSSAKLTNRISGSGIQLKDSDNEVSKDDYTQVLYLHNNIYITVFI